MLTQILHKPPVGKNDTRQLSKLMEDIRLCRGVGQMAWATTPQQIDDLADIMEIALGFRKRCDHVVLCGTGGSSLGAKTLADMVANPLMLKRPGFPQLHILESTDSECMQAVTEELPVDRTGWIFISKSGSTLETLVQFLVYLDYQKDRVTGPSLVITMPGERPIRTLAEQYAIPVRDHPPELGGRFSVFSLVGLLPAAIVGVDIAAVRQGAVTMLEEKNLQIAADAAAWHIACLREGAETQIVMPYAKRLTSWTLWYRQLWAESLGKQGKGSTPLAALGPVDHHSMLQLFLDGPANKCATVLTVDHTSGEMPLAIPAELESYTYVARHSGQEIINAQAYGTVASFLNRGIYLRELKLPDLKEHTLGALLMLGMLETVFTAALLHVDAFDQPAVEESKMVAFECLQRGII